MYTVNEKHIRVVVEDSIRAGFTIATATVAMAQDRTASDEDIMDMSSLLVLRAIDLITEQALLGLRDSGLFDDDMIEADDLV